MAKIGLTGLLLSSITKFIIASCVCVCVYACTQLTEIKEMGSFIKDNAFACMLSFLSNLQVKLTKYYK